MVKSLTLSLLFMIALMLFPSAAVEVKDLYLVKLPVAEQGKTALWHVSLKGFKEVLVRKSGSKQILQSSEVREAYRRVTNYLQRVQYATQNNDSEFPYVVSLYFEPRLIDNLINESKMPLWGANRPLTIVWLAIEEGFERQIVLESTDEDALFSDIQSNAVRRGLPVILPLMDLEDELVVSISDIWGRFPSAISLASERYAADVVLFGRLRQEGETWQGNFSFLTQTSEGAFDVPGDSKESVISLMMDRLADQLCSKYCVVEEVGIKNELLIDITDISNFQQFKAAQDYLIGLSSVSRVEVVSVDQLNVLFKLTLLGQVSSTVEGIGLSQKMLSIEPPSTTAENNAPSDGNEGIVDLSLSLGEQQDSVNETEQAEPSNDSSDKALKDDSNPAQNESNQPAPTSEASDNATQLLIQTLYYRWIG